MRSTEVLRAVEALDGAGIRAGMIDERPVGCGTPELQLVFHTHYEPRSHDIADMRALASAFGLELPPAYPRDAAIDPPVDVRGAP